MRYHIVTTEDFNLWLARIRDRQAARAIAQRLDRATAGNLGDVKPVGQGAAILIMATVNHFMLSQLSKLARLEAEMSRNIDFYALLALEMAGIAFVAFDQQPK